MAPPEHTFPVSQLEQQIHYYSVNQKVKSRKLGDFDLQRDCELLELVQYSCTTPDQQYERALRSPTGTAQMECFPFVRLFRKCQKGNQSFHVETTAWEGEHAWTPPKESHPTVPAVEKDLKNANESKRWFWSST